jgi:membrane protein implicated in regulation of membrane protease activity
MSLAFLPDTPELLKRPSRARVEQSIKPNQRGWVYWQGTSWSARFYNADYQETIPPDQSVMVIGIEGNTLLVTPIASVNSKLGGG